MGVASALADVNRPIDTINSIDASINAASRDFDSYQAPQAAPLGGEASWSTAGDSTYTTTYTVPASAGIGAGFGAGAQTSLSLGGFFHTILYGIVILLGITTVAQLVTKVMNTSFLDGLFEEARNLDPSTVSMVMNSISD